MSSRCNAIIELKLTFKTKIMALTSETLLGSGIVTPTGYTHAATANTVNLSAAFTGAANTTLTLIFDGNKWFKTSRSVN